MSKETALIRQILAHPKPDVRLWRNETGVFWSGKMQGKTRDGGVVLSHASRVSAGLCVGSSDLIGIGPGGRFVALEVKTPGVSLSKQQIRFLEVIRELGGIAAEVRSVADVEAALRGGLL